MVMPAPVRDSRAIRTAIHGRANGSEVEPESTPREPTIQHHKCPRCRHRWTTGPGADEGSWAAKGLDYVAPLLSVPEARMGELRVLASGEHRTVRDAADALGVSRRELGRRLARDGLPYMRHWLALGRILRAAEAMQSRPDQRAVAQAIGVGDPFALSTHIHHYTGVRPTEIREAPEPVWQWVADRWLDQLEATP